MDKFTIRPDEVVAIYDNGGYTLDRYTVAIETDLNEEPINYVICCNSKPFNGIGHVEEGASIPSDFLDVDSMDYDEEFHKNVGKEIQWNNLPIDVRIFATNVCNNIYNL